MDEVSRAQDLIGSTVYDREGNRIGRVDNVYVDDDTQQPEWVTVRSGFFGTRESFVPLAGASTRPDGLNVSVPKDRVKAAPRVEIEQGHLSNREGLDLYVHYGLRQPEPAGDAGADRADTTREQQREVAHERQEPVEDAELRDEPIGRHRREDDR